MTSKVNTEAKIHGYFRGRLAEDYQLKASDFTAQIIECAFQQVESLVSVACAAQRAKKQ